MQLKWMPSTRCLNPEAQAMSRSNAPQKRQRDQTDSPPDQQAEQDGTARATDSPTEPAGTPAPKQHRASQSKTVFKFKYLPAGFEVGKERIGSAGAQPDCAHKNPPLRNVLYPPAPDGSSGRTRVYDALRGKTMPDGESLNRFSKTWLVPQQSYDKEYAETFNYVKTNGVRQLPTANPVPAPTQTACFATGKPNVNSLVNDALSRRLTSITVLYTLAAAYEEKLQERDAELARLRRRQAMPGAAPPPSTPGAPNRHKRKTAPATETTAETPQPATQTKSAGRKPKERATDAAAAAAAEEAAKRKKRWWNLRIFWLMATAAEMLGGSTGLTLFVVMMIRSAVCKTGLVRRHIYLAKDVIKMMVDDQALYKVLTKTVDAKRKPRWHNSATPNSRASRSRPWTGCASRRSGRLGIV